MKTYLPIALIVIALNAYAQIRQNIIKLTGTDSNLISEMDSIRFNDIGNEFQVVLLNGETISHAISEIENISFEILFPAHSCGSDSVHNSSLTYSSMTDQEGNIYRTIVIGSQEWMAENLNTGKYRNGDTIQNVINTNEWSVLSTGAWCYYNNDSQNACPYGKLYNWYAVADSRNICPEGWHVPTDTEWSVLINHLDYNASGGNNFNYAGAKMKSTGTSYWTDLGSPPDNTSGFSAMATGYRLFNGGSDFGNLGINTYWWSSTELFLFDAWTRRLMASSASAERTNNSKRLGLSVRCLRN